MERSLKVVEDKPAWYPVQPEFSCATCFWNWHETVPVVGPSCHLMPRQMVVINGQNVVGTLPMIGNPERNLCSQWRSRQTDTSQ